MHSIRTKTMLPTALAIVLTTLVTTYLGIHAIRNVSDKSSNQLLLLLCESGEKNLDSYFIGIEKSVDIVSEFAQNDLKGLDASQLQDHIDRVSDVFANTARHTNGILTYYYRIDPDFSKDVKGFWFVDTDGTGFTEHEVTEISLYDTQDTSALVWFTVPKYTGKPVWLHPYITDNLDKRVISYNIPIYQNKRFVGVIGIELDYSTMATQVNNIQLYENGYAFINDDNGMIIYHPSIDVTTLTKENTPKTPDGLLTDNQFIRYTFDGVEKQAVCLKLVNGMRLNVTVPVSEINRDSYKLINNIIIVSIILLTTFILLTLKLTNSVTKPLRELTNAAEKLAEGDYEVELAYQGNDEVGILSHAFNYLIGKLKIYIRDLNTLNEQLKEDNLTLQAATTKDSLTGVKNRFALRRDYENYIEK